ncbi:MAG: hypothetical protein COV30_01615 [Candidatus Yanofskybacteria bacterium CG10_big_fil_rev_8_21_14_0_10_37_15]|uniref:Uncharacterized protein n=1 Tax=Candidatus Yanofskybacteria bacterium CG10_big_fil_rev_8_21_14_0_10_37_15 TaxID=1975097 RepID=A0A2H0R5R7_9BACT|nr:MAG: hypothetical protein COV30_01615 [Candidatus Yanofskybacteria bacterium CG10_big_fil_rev_8_21_14_0_10_37_15]
MLFLLASLLVSSVVFFFLSSFVFDNQTEPFFQAIIFLLGIMCVLSLTFSPAWFPQGIPLETIDSGVYCLEFIEITDGFVNIGVKYEGGSVVFYRLEKEKFRVQGPYYEHYSPNKKIIVMQIGSSQEFRLE